MADNDKTAMVLRLMTPKQAEVWGLIFLGYRQREIAAELCKSEAAVSRLVDRGRRRVKKYTNLLKKCKDFPRKG